MRTLASVLAVIIIATSSCVKERENIDTRIPEKPQRLASVMWSSESRAVKRSFTYDDAGYLSEETMEHFFNHNGEFLPSPGSISRMVYERDADNKITRTILRDDLNVRVGEYKYANEALVGVAYFNNGTLSFYDSLNWYKGKLVQYSTYVNDKPVAAQRMLYDKQGNLQEIVYYREYKEWFRCYNFRYDNTAAVGNTIKGASYELLMSLSLNNVPDFSANNIVVADFEQYDIPAAGTWVYHLSYDDKGRITQNIRNNGQQKVEYFYEEY